VEQISSGLQNAVRSDSKTGTVRTTELHPSGRQEGPFGRSTLKHQKKIEENFTEIKFSQVSVRTCMYNQLITQSESISKLNRDIKEGCDFPSHRKISNRQLNSLNARVCVKTLFPQGMTFNILTNSNQIFLDRRENKWKISQKSNLTRAKPPSSDTLPL
jgi:hypothetical protein